MLPNVKRKILEVIVQLRTLDSNQYKLDQTRLLNFLNGVWGSDQGSLTPHKNDKVRLFGLIMTIEENRPKFQRLAEGHKDWYGMDNVTLSLAEIFRALAFNFSNEDIHIDLPENADDIQGINNLDPNDITRIRIERDGKIFL